MSGAPIQKSIPTKVDRWLNKSTLTVLFLMMTLFLGVVGIAARSSSQAAAAAREAAEHVQPIADQTRRLEADFNTHQVLQAERDKVVVEKLTKLTELLQKQGDEQRELWKKILSKNGID